MFNNKIKAINPVEYAKGIVANEKIRFDDSNNKNKYFAKYLPVEGEIKEGDLVRNNLDGIIGNSIRPITKAEVDDKEYSKVKLFLCSRDIEFSDTIYHSDGKLITQQEKNKYGRNEILVWRSAGCFKVIGEISPEATWVKEGDEFDDKDIELCYKDEISNFDSSMDWTECEYERVLKYIKLKGPCGHYH